MSVSREEFHAFVRTTENNNHELRDILRNIMNRLPVSATPSGPVISSVAEAQFSRFQNVLPRPNSSRSSQKTSFVNVGVALKTGIQAYNSSLPDESDKIVTTELDDSPLSWSHNVYSSVAMIIGRFAGLNAAFGKCSFDEAKKLSHFKGRKTRYNREVANAINEIRMAFPILTLSRGDWAARELLRNKFQSALTANKRKKKKDAQSQSTAPRHMNQTHANGRSDTPTSRHDGAHSSLLNGEEATNPRKKDPKLSKNLQKGRSGEKTKSSRGKKKIATNALMRPRPKQTKIIEISDVEKNTSVKKRSDSRYRSSISRKDSRKFETRDAGANNRAKIKRRKISGDSTRIKFEEHDESEGEDDIPDFHNNRYEGRRIESCQIPADNCSESDGSEY